MRAPKMGSAPEPLAAQLKRHRGAAGLTQEELAARAGVSVRSIGDLERGAGHRPRKDTVALLAEALGLPPGEREAFVAAARRAPAPPGGGDSPPRGEDDAPIAACGWPLGPWPRRPRWRGAGALGLGALVALGVGISATAAVWPRRAAAPPAPAVTIVGPHQAACCWAKQGTWYADGLHGYPGFAGPCAGRVRCIIR